MNFTREPIIETIISPRDGFKLLVRNSKGGETEEYLVDALEVVSFGQAFFLRSLERPKSFLVPASDYEVVEVKEARMALKNISHEKNIKIGGGREASIRGGQPPAERETPDPAIASEEDSSSQEGGAASQPPREPRSDRGRRDRRRHRRRRGDEQWSKPQDAPKEGAVQGESTGEEPSKVSPPVFSGLFPPPPSLISETIGRYKGQEFFDKDRAEKKQTPPEESPASGESTPLSRGSVQTESATLTTTAFLPPPGFDPLF